MPHRRRIHIMREGREVPTDEDEDEVFVGKRALGDAGHGSLRHFAIACGANEPDIERLTSPSLHGAAWLGPTRSVALWLGCTVGSACLRWSFC